MYDLYIFIYEYIITFNYTNNNIISQYKTCGIDILLITSQYNKLVNKKILCYNIVWAYIIFSQNV